MKKENNRALLYLPLIGTVVLFAVANLAKVKQLWGLNLLKFLDSTVIYIVLPIVVLASLPPISSRLHRLLTDLSAAGKNRLLLAAVVIAVSVTGLGFAWPSATHLLGDAHLRLNQITDGKLFLATEILDFFAHSVLYSQLLHSYGYDTPASYHVISALCGMIFTFGVFRLARYLAPEQLWAGFVMMASSGLMVLFFGYVESYSIIAAMLPYIFLCGLKAYEGQSSKILYLAMCVAAALVHTVAVILLLPGLVMMFLATGAESNRANKRTTIILMVGAVALIVAAYIGRFLDIGSIGYYLMPFVGREEFRHGIFAANHYLNILNWLFLAGLPVLMLAMVVIARSTFTNICSNPRTLYALWVAIPSVLFVFFFVPQLGGPADWDLFALPVFLLALSVMTMYLAHSKGKLPVQSIPAAMVSLALVFSFVTINADVAKSVDRFVEVIEVSKFKNLTKQYRLLVIATQSRPEVRHRQLEFLHKAWEQPPYTKADSVGVLSDLGAAYLEGGDRQRAYQYILSAVQADSLNLESHQTLGRYLRKFGTSEDLFNLARTIERRFARNAEGMMSAGIVYQDAGDAERSGECLKRAYELDNESYYVLLSYGSYLLRAGEYEKSLEVFKRVTDRNPGSFQGHYLTAVAYLNLGQTDKARESARKAAEEQHSDSDTKLLMDLERSLR